MKAEVVGVGTELLLGQIADTNAQHISQVLAGAGVDVLYHTAVGDNLGRMAGVIRTAVGRSDVVIVTGGLGPTPDDITRQAVAEALGRPLERDEELAARVSAIFDRLGRVMPEDNLRQADLPVAAVAIEPEGTAPGFHIDHGGSLLFALPGVPWEMKAMLAKVVVPMLRARAGDHVIVSRQVLVVGLGESSVQEEIGDIVERQTNPTIAYLAGGGQVKVRLTAKASGEAAALALIAPVEDEIRGRLGDAAVPGNHDDMTGALGELLRAKGLTVAAAESLTGGLMGAELSRVPGSSDFFLGSIVTYSTEAKHEVAGVPKAVLEVSGAISAPTAAALADAARKRFGAHLGLSATGVAGPSEQEGTAVGTVFVGASVEGRTEARRIRGYGDRSNIRAMSVTAAFDLGRRLVCGLV